ncbi:AAA family ATPase [Runella sp.]|uniref:AAA family ATPase n=1 Tax=Runella sp. TaxID=1960881 RepID=UPI00301A485F
MYITEIELTNIRSVQKLHLKFPKPAGWHVLLGDNGAGKSSVIRAISAAIVGPSEILRLDPDFSTWVTSGKKKATINLEIERHEVDKRYLLEKLIAPQAKKIHCQTVIEQDEGNGKTWKFKDAAEKKGPVYDPEFYNWGSGDGWFSAAFGPYRRFTGGDQSLESFYFRNPKIAAHLTAFKDAALTESVVWLKDLQFRSLSKPKSEAEETIILNGIQHFINQDNLLPQGFRLKEITPDGPFFTIPDKSTVHLYELSEGIKSVTSLAFELMRLLLRVYPAKEVFGNFLDDNKQNDFVPVPGVVLIDEIDAHLHPTWQARIGQWFTRCFPNIQFIVTTHSPIICRAAVNGSVWRLPNPGDDREPSQITGTALDRLLYGDILDAYGTGAFGADVTRDEAGFKKLSRLAELNVRFYRSEASEAEVNERSELIKIFPSDDSVFS